MSPVEISNFRHENKYLIPERLAVPIRDYISFFCSPDSNSPTGDGRYTVNTLYFDTINLTFFHDTLSMAFARIKPRIRYFGSLPTEYLWLEVKRRVEDTIWKSREKIPFEAYPALLEKADPPMLKAHPKGHRRISRTLDSFRNVVDAYEAVPIVHVHYQRESYISDTDDYLRITFDRRLTARMARGEAALPENQDNFHPFDDTDTCQHPVSPVILEIKCETKFPRWILDLVQRFSVTQRGFSKYCHAVTQGLARRRVVQEIRTPRF